MEHLRWAADELGIACLVNLHQVDFALEFSDRIVGLKGGKMVFDGPPGDLDEKTAAAIYATSEEGPAPNDDDDPSTAPDDSDPSAVLVECGEPKGSSATGEAA